MDDDDGRRCGQWVAVLFVAAVWFVIGFVVGG